MDQASQKQIVGGIAEGVDAKNKRSQEEEGSWEVLKNE